MFVRNCWYVAAWGSEVGREPFARTILGEPVVLYRTESGRAVALEDRCCHRNLPLSMGRIEGDAVRCGYHGLKFDPTGACIEVPGQSAIPPGARVRSYPLIERWKLLWIWMGDASRLDESLLPGWHYIDDPRFAVAHGNDAKPLPMKSHWELNNDNLLDLSHVVYVHPTTLGAHALDFPITTERFERKVRMSRWIPNSHPIPLWAKYLNHSGNVDRWQDTDCEFPSHCTVDVGFAPVGRLRPGDDRDHPDALRLRALITATPETETSSFMFYAQCRNFAVADEEMTRKFVRDVRVIFMEDVTIMEGQQRNLSRRPDAPRIDINSDAPHLAMRQLVRRFAAEEGRVTGRSAA